MKTFQNLNHSSPRHSGYSFSGVISMFREQKDANGLEAHVCVILCDTEILDRVSDLRAFSGTGPLGQYPDATVLAKLWRQTCC